MKLSGKKGIQHIVMSLAALGLEEVVLCPGSRNVPLMISFNRHPAFRCTSIRDERSAAFFALGKALELQKPVALVCTSGSATLNFAPAVSEAYYQRVPLMILTADRPGEWIGQGDGQTINQTCLYRNFIRGSYTLRGDASTPTDFWYNRRCLSEGYNIATLSDPGPVHFNVPLSEPLYQVAETADIHPGIFKETETEKKLTATSLSVLKEEFAGCTKVMILTGQHRVDPVFREELVRMAGFENVIVLTESLSNTHHSRFIENIDRCITNFSKTEAEEWAPELLITVGGAVVSKRIKAFLREQSITHHWHIDSFDAMQDTYQSLTRAIPMDPAVFFQQLQPVLPQVVSGYREKWLKRKDRLAILHEAFFDQCAYSDLLVFYKLYQHIPANTFVHLSNSSPIRYAQLFDNQEIAGSFSNRGTSGIDGCTSTAVGAATAAPQKSFLLITGDVAFHYDINALWNNTTVDNLKILVINNGGGGIFRIIAAPHELDEMEAFLETSMTTNAEKLAAHFGWDYLPVRHENVLEESLQSFFKKVAGRTILEIFTDAKKNPVILEQYWEFLKENFVSYE
ncbi:MAG: 2-succinyl-5-enolpyruvyl-6-hydroxy-3-cyclohexene-1-carboxylic-acid synthase [Chitinophagaceae bacterium]|nr:2-succinyl-5-enolpyruvyl-6-hydroxy-3-cyclohexene-1-carboxylic-acid synthase [Chitinophagaceae bacterium]